MNQKILIYFTSLTYFIFKSFSRNKILFFIASYLFSISFLVSIFFPYPFNLNYVANNYIKLFEVKNISFLFFIKRNEFVIFIILVGAFLFSVPTIINLVYNGLIFGSSISIFVHNRLYNMLLLILPHGIFEIPAIIIAGAAGFKIPYEIVRYLAGKKEQPLTKQDIKEYLTLALISIILIVIAAFVEAYVTPKIAEYFLSKNI